MNFVFIYARNNKIRVLSEEYSKLHHKRLLKKGWIHTTTLTPCTYLEYLHNKCPKEHIRIEIESLSKINK